MNRQKWTYVGDNGYKANIGIIHFPKKGQVLIYCESRVIVLDFKVFESKSYTFFIEEELCRIELEKTVDNKYLYGFQVLVDEDTPLNAQRKSYEKKQNIKGIAAFFGLVIVVALIVAGGHHLYKKNLRNQLEKNGATTEGTIYIIPLENSYKVGYQYTTPDFTYRKAIEYYEQPNPISSNGMPLVTGDQFFVRYVPDNQLNAMIKFEEPTPTQIKTYKTRSLQVYKEYHATENDDYCNCLINIAHQLEGVDGLAYFYHQRVPISENPKYNVQSYENFIRSQAFLEAEEDCWTYK